MTWVAIQPERPSEMLVLQYTRPGGPDRSAFEGKTDPLAGAKEFTHGNQIDLYMASQIVRILQQCGIRKWVASSNTGISDVPPTARAHMRSVDVDIASFNCLSAEVSSPFVSLYRESAN